MAIGLAALIAALVAAAGAGIGTGYAGGLTQDSGVNNKNGPTKYSGWGSKFANFMGDETDISASELGDWYKKNYTGEYSDYLNSLSDAELGAILEQYYNSENVFGGKRYVFDTDEATSELESLINSLSGYEAPEAPNYAEIYKDAQNVIDAENNELLASLNSQYQNNLNLLNANTARQTQSFNDELSNLNSMYNDYSRQILSNDYMRNAQLTDSVTSALSKSKQNALEAGASAGARLAGNINTIMSMQNKQTQQSLETSNQLAQQLLNQRQAAAGIRGNYNDMLNYDTQSRLGLSSNYGDNIRSIKQGSTERKNNYANQQFQTQQSIYENQLGNYEDSMASHSSNPFYGSYQAYRQSKNKNNQGY